MSEDPQQLALALRIVALAMGAGAVAAALWCGSVALRAWRAERFPPPGLAPVTRRLELAGPHARRAAALLLVLSGLLGLTGIALPVVIWRILAALGRP